MIRAMQDAHILFESLPPTHRSLRVAMVSETYPPEINGVATTVAQMIEALRARDHEVQLIRPRGIEAMHGGHPSTSTPKPVPAQTLAIARYSALKSGLPAKQALLRLWSLNRPDIAHIVTAGPLGWSALAVAHKLRIPSCSDFHHDTHSFSPQYGVGWLRKPIAGYLRRFHNKAHCTLVPTQALRDELTNEGYLNLRVVRRGVDTRLFNPARRSRTLRKRWGVADGQLVALYVGRLVTEKNLPVLIQAYTAMRAAVPGLRLVVVGDGPERHALQAQEPGILFAGTQTGAALAEHYASADIFLFPGTRETFGNVVIEAMASGLAVVAHKHAAAAAHIVHTARNENGVLAPLNNSREFVNLAVRLACDPQRVTALGRAAHLSMELLDWRHTGADLETALREIIAAQHRPEVIDDCLTIHADPKH